VPAADHLRLLGAFVDILVSVAMVGAAIGVMALTLETGSDKSILPPLLILLAFWALDVVLYALPIRRFGWSLGNVLTRRRVVDHQSGGPLPFRRAVRRYFARRNVLAWLWDNASRDAARFEDLSYERVAGVPLGISTGLLSLAIQNYAPPDPTGPTESNADRRAGSAVVRSRPSAADRAYTSDAITLPS
jgi:hypothetical protein